MIQILTILAATVLQAADPAPVPPTYHLEPYRVQVCEGNSCRFVTRWRRVSSPGPVVSQPQSAHLGHQGDAHSSHSVKRARKLVRRFFGRLRIFRRRR